MTTKMFGQRVPRVEDPRLRQRATAATSTTSGTTRSAAAFVRSPHAHARIVDIDVSAALEVEGLVAIYTYDDLDGRSGRAAAAADPAPDADARPHAVRAGQRTRSTTSARRS